MRQMALKSMAIAVLLTGACSGRGPKDPEARLESAASELARFLAGYGRFDALNLADSVDLYIAPDGGGGHVRMARERLRDPHDWKIGTDSTARSFVPRGLRTRVVTDVGHYMNCTPSSIATRYPEYAALPHVGVRLEPPRVKSCLETWNATFVYDTTGGGAPRLVAAIYDQWEW
jgi:hypothetical protein